jgi:hypothetical protein
MTSSIENIMAEKKKYEHLKKYEKLSKTAGDMIRMHERTHVRAYQEAEKLLVTGEGREVDIDKLNEDDIQEQFVQKMKKVYLKKAKEVLKASPADKFEEELLMNAYAGTTENELKIIVARYKNKLTFEQYKDLSDKNMTPKVANVLVGAAGSHLTEKHIDDILEYALHPEAVKQLKGYITLNQAKSLLDNFIAKEEKLGLGDIVKYSEQYKIRRRGEDFLPPPIVSKLEKALEEKRKKAKVGTELPEAA